MMRSAIASTIPRHDRCNLGLTMRSHIATATTKNAARKNWIPHTAHTAVVTRDVEVSVRSQSTTTSASNRNRPWPSNASAAQPIGAPNGGSAGRTRRHTATRVTRINTDSMMTRILMTS